MAETATRGDTAIVQRQLLSMKSDKADSTVWEFSPETSY